jgi:two-component system aerobic respiration control sensor histidine kinase ArcB
VGSRDETDDFEAGRVGFSRKILVWSSLTIAISASISGMLLVFAVGSTPERVLPTLYTAVLFLIFPMLLRLGVRFRYVRDAFFAFSLIAVLGLGLQGEGGIVSGYASHLPIFICLSGMLYRTRGVIVVAALSALIVIVTGTSDALRAPFEIAMPTGSDVMTTVSRQMVGIGFAAVLVIVAMRIFKDLLARLSAARDEARANSEAKSNFLAGLGHEVRTPLNAIIGMAEILKTEDLKPEQRQKVETITNAGGALLEMMNDILDSAQIEATRMTINPQRQEMADLFEGFLRLWAPIAEQKGISFRMEIADDIPDALLIDPQRTRQCVNNLLSNALKFTDDGSIRLIARWDVRPGSPKRLVIEVQDTGIGMPADAAERVFAPFEQVHKADGSYGGSGLGLSITRSLAKLMKGDLTFKSVQGEGTLFTLTIAAEPAPEEDEEILDLSAITRTNLTTDATGDDGEPENWTSNAHVLVVDDVETNRFVATGYLSTLGAHVTEAENGQEALDLALSKSFDLILMDRHMPETDGLWALKQFKMHPKTQNIPIVLVTAGTSEEDARLCREHGASDVMLKPFTLSALHKLLRKLDTDASDACVR